MTPRLSSPPNPPGRSSKLPTAIIITTAMLTFISFWRAAAVVLCDLASSAYYVGGIAERSIGKAAPWFVLGVMLFAYLVRFVYIESCAMFVRGGVYNTVRKALGSTMAKVAVSALLFDYVLTGPISSVSAGHYLAGLLNTFLQFIHFRYRVPGNLFAMVVAILITLYFHRKNLMGIEESSDKAFKIMQWTGVMVVILIIWSLITIIKNGAQLPPITPHLSDGAMGWLHGMPWIKTIGFFGVAIGFGHSILAMSGEESLAQVYRDIESPKLLNLKRASLVIWVFSILFTAMATFFAVMLIPDQVRVSQYGENLIAGLAAYLAGPSPLKLVFQVFVVVMGAVILGGAVNTAIVGSTGVLNRVTDDGILPRWFKGLNKKYGTTHRIINLIVGLQIFTILVSRGDVFILGEAYAFGVLWSFVFNGLSVTVLRFKDKSPREWRVPMNLRVGRLEIPLGLIIITLMLLVIAILNFFTKTIATQAGLAFIVILFIVFSIVEHVNKKGTKKALPAEQFNLERKDTITEASLDLAEEEIFLVAVSDPHNLIPLKKRLENMPDNSRIIVFKARRGRLFQGDLAAEELNLDEQELFTNVVRLAEKYGHDVIPMIVPSNNPVYAIVKTAVDIKASEIILGVSNKVPPDIQLEQLAMAWGTVHPPEPRLVKIRIISEQKELSCDLT